MARVTIADKRAALFREWLLALNGNNESYYWSTVVFGIPDGDDVETVLDDLQDGFYDDDIDDILTMYRNRREIYGKDGWYIGNKLYKTVDDALHFLAIIHGGLPVKIYKQRAE